MEAIFFAFMLLSLSCFRISSQHQYSYNVVPDNRNCSLSENRCYTLRELIDSEVLSSAEPESSASLIFHPGTHVIPESTTLQISDISEVIFLPLNQEDYNVTITCEQEPGFFFEYISELKIIGLQFQLCSLQYGGINTNHNRSISITNCTFEGTRTEPAVNIRNTESNLKTEISSCTFVFNNGAVSMIPPFTNHMKLQMKHLTITDTLFQSNRREAFTSKGGAVSTAHTVLIIKGCQFINNSAGSSLAKLSADGGAISSHSSSVAVFDSLFFENHAEADGSAIHLFQSGVYSRGCRFTANSAGGSGTVYIVQSSLPSSFIDNAFEGNKAEGNGGAIFVSRTIGTSIESCQFRNNSAFEGGALYLEYGSDLEMSGNLVFAHNRAVTKGGGIYSHNGVYSSIFSDGTFDVISNSADKGGFAFLSNCELLVDFGSTYTIRSNTAVNGGAVYAIGDSSLSIDGFMNFYNNFATEHGGALYLFSAVITLKSSALVLFNHNTANDCGGAIFVSDANCEAVTPNTQCFVNTNFDKLVFINNSAEQGSILYGGLLDRCCGSSTAVCDTSDTSGIDNFRSFSLYEPIPLGITSDPVRICLCTTSHEPDCATRNVTVFKARGQAIHLIGAVFDQNNTPKPSFIRARYIEGEAQLDKGEGGKGTTNECIDLVYHIFTRSNTATLLLQPEGYCEDSSLSSITVNVRITPCLKGFEVHQGDCICDRRLKKLFRNRVECNINSGTIQIEETVWLRYDTQYLLVHINCPLDYCQELDTITLADPDLQCAKNRSGVICGSCRTNYSVGLGGSKCLPCTSNYSLIWLIPIFALAGVLLVFLLLACNMSISHGTINGLIFYCNIVSITGILNLRNCTVNPFFSVFIAWVNLDFGVETCFFSGMNTYEKTWLQFVFPLYIWLLVGAIIIVSHFSATAMKAIGRNSIAVVATLFLLSYTKVLKTIAVSLSFAEVLQGSANDMSDPLMPRKVWLYDGNFRYLKGNHLILFVAAFVLLVFLFVPYTLLITFGQWIRSLPTEKRFIQRCIRSTAFTSVIDAYHAPYTNKHRYWTGLMLISRCVLFLAFALNYNNNKLLKNTYTNVIVLVIILTLKLFISKVYTKAWISKLETCFILNLLILSATLQYLGSNGTDEGILCICISVSISITMLLFVCILGYHAYLVKKKVQCFRYIKNAWRARRSAKQSSSSTPSLSPPTTLPTSTTVELREKLLVYEASPK